MAFVQELVRRIERTHVRSGNLEFVIKGDFDHFLDDFVRRKKQPTKYPFQNNFALTKLLLKISLYHGINNYKS